MKRPATPWISVLLLLPASVARGQPVISGISDAAVHEGELVIGGQYFGIKDPAAPLMWDNCENAVVDNDAEIADSGSVLRNDGSVGWDDFHPSIESANAAPYPVEARLRYRTIPHEGTDAPHSRSEKYLAACHYTYPENTPAYIGSGGEYFRDVQVTVDTGTADKSKWFAIWYYRLNPAWSHPCYPNNNHKTAIVNTGARAYSGIYAYDAYTSQAPCVAGEAQLSVRHGSAGCDTHDYYTSANPREGWIHYEYRFQSDSQVGRRDVLFDNLMAGGYDSNCPNWLNNTRSFTIGGYYR